MVVFFWCGGVFVVVVAWWCFCGGGVFVVALFFCGAIPSSIFSKGDEEILPPLPEVLLAQLVEPQSCKA